MHHLERLRGQDDVFFNLDTFFFRRARPMLRAANQRVGGLLACDTVNMLFSPSFRIPQYHSWLATGSAPRMAVTWSYTHNGIDEWATNEPEEVHLFQNDA